MKGQLDLGWHEGKSGRKRLDESSNDIDSTGNNVEAADADAGAGAADGGDGCGERDAGLLL
jgi:hypothetical protein